MAFLVGNEGNVQPRRPLREAGRPRKATYNLGALYQQRGDVDEAPGQTRFGIEMPPGFLAE